MVAKPNLPPAPPGFHWIFRPYFRHRITKQIIYPKRGKVIAMLVRN